MGTCLCKEKREERRVRQREQQEQRRGERGSRTSDRRQRDQRHRQWRNALSTDSDIEQQAYDDPVSIEMDIKDLIRQTLKVIRTLVNNEQEPPQSLLKLNLIADKERGWLMVVKALIETVPDNDSLGPAVITLFLDECPLPSKETIHRLLFSMEFSGDLAKKKSPGWHKNACIVLGSLAEKLAGSTAVAMFSHDVQQYLIACVVNNAHIGGSYQMILFALLALEKFAQTSENQHMICRTFEQIGQPLLELETWLEDKSLESNWLAQQVGFCAQWSLDNIFVSENRQFAYESADVSGINAMLNHEDVSEYLKIGPDGLEARCDVSSFESVRCTFEAVEGVWYYEATVLTPGVMQIGLATKRSRFLNHEGYGIGDDDCSVAYDGCRQLVWYNANSTKHEHPPWKQGDVVGVLLNIPEKYVRFSLNGIPLYQKHKEFLFQLPEGDGVFAAASFMSFQQCRFNFGAMPFRFPPKNIEFRYFLIFVSLYFCQRDV
ncbi:hypothetical protein WR25_19214 [Diploscapter pachys]|uniref:B30.2/SPRY domain-containing protein n=1 Tax=Diploscapter pachys TaxID=2018661 RepID=A0A2A2KRK1_9BILA|nr:hypothetical protein WR25_19214 [Diploscapter pachys]